MKASGSGSRQSRSVDAGGFSCADRKSQEGRPPSWLRVLVGDLGWCAAVAVALTLIFTPFLRPPNLIGLAWGLLVNLLISTGIGLSVGNLYRHLYPRLADRLRGRAQRALLHAGMVGLGVAIGVELAVRSIDVLGGPAAAQMRWNAMQVGAVIATIAVALSIAYERLRLRAQEEEARAERATKEALRAQLQALQARTNPHFLFNCLNTVAGLIEESPQQAERVVERLAALFRYALRSSETRWVRLDEELEAVRTYLAVEAIRLGERLSAELRVAPELGTLLVPPLVLQPLVENAVLHAVAPRKEGGRLRVEAERRNGQLLLSVVDDGPGPGGSPHRGSGTALSDLDRRLELYYGGAASASAEAGDGGGYRVRLTLPLGVAP